jgi:thiol-disulfide isomerase/thioredoxin
MLSIRRTTYLAVILTAIMFAGCSDYGMEETRLSVPEPYDSELLAQYRALTTEGYDFLEEDENRNLDSALARFTEMAELIPEAKSNHYHMACAYNRMGQEEKAFESLTRMVEAGWEKAWSLPGDPDLESLVDDPRFEGILERARSNAAPTVEILRQGVPEYDQAPDVCASEEEFEAWSDSVSRVISRNGRVWHHSEYVMARMDFAARRLACLRELRKDSADFDYGLERVRASAQLVSPYSQWGVTAEAVVKEVDNYVSGSPSEAGASEANLWAGFAWTARIWDEEDPLRADVLRKSNEYLARVGSGSDYYAMAQTLLIANDLELDGGTDKQQYKERVRAALDGNQDNNWIKRIVTMRFQHDAIALLWPIPFEFNDIDGVPVDLADYAGKALLIDFWATWCRPCRSEMPNIVRNYRKYHDQGFDIISISFDYESRMPIDSFRVWIEENGMEWRHIYDGKDWDSEVGSKFFISSIPAPFMVGRDGKLIASGEDCYGVKLSETIERALGSDVL